MGLTPPPAVHGSVSVTSIWSTRYRSRTRLMEAAARVATAWSLVADISRASNWARSRATGERRGCERSPAHRGYSRGPPRWGGCCTTGTLRDFTVVVERKLYGRTLGDRVIGKGRALRKFVFDSRSSARVCMSRCVHMENEFSATHVRTSRKIHVVRELKRYQAHNAKPILRQEVRLIAIAATPNVFRKLLIWPPQPFFSTGTPRDVIKEPGGHQPQI